MAYRAPRYSYVHAARDVGASAITVSDTAHADFPKDNLIDDRNQTLFKWSAAVTNPSIVIDLGSGFVTGLSRLIIPADHNIESIYIEQDTTSGFASPTALHASSGTPDTTPTPGTLYDSGTFDTANSSEQFIRVNIVGSSTQYYLAQLFLTKTLTLTVGPDLSGSADHYRANVTRLEQNTGMLPTIQHGPQQRMIDYVYPAALSSTDLSAMEAFLASVGMARPFYVDPASFSTPPETDEPALCMKLLTMPRVTNAVDVPFSGVRRKVFNLQLIESVD